ncbi:MAG: hypothetical protein E6J34_16600 [Chloroflexi bacterium]|nr:MAG: hypothetical protein E6J34_16600 [Chloroflexota bacterium]
MTITSPDQHTTVVGPPLPPVPFAGTNQPGIYQVTQQVRGQVLNGAFTVNLFNSTQSELAPARALPVANSSNFTTATMGLSHQLREIWPWIAALLLLVLCAEWWLFSSSYRVQKCAVAQQDRQAQRNATARRDILASPPPQNTLAARLQHQLQERYRLVKKRSRRLARKHLPHTAKQTGSKTQITKGDKHANL